jgi:hypothetical protein
MIELIIINHPSITHPPRSELRVPAAPRQPLFRARTLSELLRPRRPRHGPLGAARKGVVFSHRNGDLCYQNVINIGL